MLLVPGLSVFRRDIAVCAVAVPVLAAAPAALGYDIRDRWTVTQTDGGGIQRGDAITLTWSFVPDGENWSRGVNSDLIAYLDDGWEVDPGDRTPDLTNRAWWGVANQVYEQYERVSGLTMVYLPELLPDGSDSGQFGDIRIGGSGIDGPGGVLANNTYPNGGDMKIDTDRDNEGNVVSLRKSADWRNVVSHESGHGVGLGHSDINGANAVMESKLQTSFWGLQFDDIYAFNRLYGDPMEKDGGNDSFATASDLGELSLSSTVSLGTDANDSAVNQFDDDWVGIDGTSDIDYFRFSLDSASAIDLLVDPQGPTYTTDEQGPDTDFSAQSDLNITLYASGQNAVAASDSGGVGEGEALLGLQLPAGEYFIAVDGEADLNQFYRIDLTLIEEIIQPPDPADLSQDGDVDDEDLGIAFSNFTGPDAAGASLIDGDLSGDGDIDDEDIGLIFSAFTGPGGEPVPEPGGAWLLLAAGSLVVRRRRARS